MSNLDKHKPLSSEELFKLLDNQSGKQTDLEDMDDFEKEALEGFSTHSTSQKAKALTEELNSAISKKVEEAEGKGGAKNKIIWFSAAASIALIILVSVFFFNQSRQDSENNLALKEVAEDNKPPAVAEQNTGLETVTKGNTIVEEHKEQESTKSQGVVVNTKNAEEVTLSGIIAEPSMAISENKLSSVSGETGSKDESKNRRESDLDVLQKQAVVLTDKTDVKKKEKSSVEQEVPADGYATNQNVATTTSTNEEADKNYKLDEANDSEKTENLAQMSKEKAASNKSNDNSVSYTKTSPVPASGSSSVENNNPYYTGSELAIKEFVLSYLKSKKTSKLIIGKYKIVGKVNVKGELSVSEIKQISLEDCNCTELIKEALNTMNKWHPAIQNGKAIQSNVDFILMF